MRNKYNFILYSCHYITFSYSVRTSLASAVKHGYMVVWFDKHVQSYSAGNKIILTGYLKYQCNNYSSQYRVGSG